MVGELGRSLPPMCMSALSRLRQGKDKRAHRQYLWTRRGSKERDDRATESLVGLQDEGGVTVRVKRARSKEARGSRPRGCSR